MRRINFKMAMFFVALFASGVAVAQNNDVETNKTSTIPTLTVVEEDFSKWTAGSFDEPDRTENLKAKAFKFSTVSSPLHRSQKNQVDFLFCSFR